MNKKFLPLLLCVIFALCVAGLTACDKLTSSTDDYATWLNSDLAEDYDGDRRITEEDYEIYKKYIAWKNSEKAYDYNGDKKINYDDYKLSQDPEIVEFATWLDSDKACDYDANGVIDEKDYAYYVNYKGFIGNFKVVNFNYQTSRDRAIYLNDNYELNDLAQDIEEFSFRISNDLKLTCSYGNSVKQKLGADESAVLSAISSCAFDKLSDSLTTASFDFGDLNFVLYLTKTDGGFSSAMNYVIDDVSVTVNFDIVYVK